MKVSIKRQMITDNVLLIKIEILQIKQKKDDRENYKDVLLTHNSNIRRGQISVKYILTNYILENINNLNLSNTS